MKKNGFTLIELLAVIIILAIIALIATPIILNIIESTRDEADLRTVDGLVDGGRQFCANAMFDESARNDINKVNNVYEKIIVSGYKPNTGDIYVNDKCQIAIKVVLREKCYVKKFESNIEVKTGECDDFVGKDDVIPTVDFELLAGSINDKGWSKEDLKIKIIVKDDKSGPSSYRWCSNITDCAIDEKDNNNLVNMGEGFVDLQAEGNNKICAIGYDKAGNKSDLKCSEVYKIDKTKPIIDGIDDVKLNLGDSIDLSSGVIARDNISGLNGDLIYIPNSIDTSKIDLTKVTYKVSDIAGNETVIERNVEVLGGAPSITFNTNITPNSNNWFNTDFYVKGSITDNSNKGIKSIKWCSDIAPCTPISTVTDEVNIKISTESNTNKVCIEAIDNNDKKTTLCSDDYKLDKTKPIINGVADLIIWKDNIANLTNGVTATDSLSSVNGSYDYNPKSVDTSKAGTTNITYTVSDKAGNSTSVTRKVIVDAAAPTITYTPQSGKINAAGWAKENFIVQIDLLDNSGLGIKEGRWCSSNTSSTCTPNATISGTTLTPQISLEGSNRICVQTTDNNNKSSEISCSDVYKLDKTAPNAGSANISGSIGENNWYTSNVTITPINGSDGLSGHSSTTTNISNITANTGGQVVTITTTDIAGNIATRNYTIKVDKDNPVIGADFRIQNTTVVATLSDNFSLAGYAITNSAATPSYWTGISGNSIYLTSPALASGNYYLHIKDTAGRTAISAMFSIVDVDGHYWIILADGNTYHYDKNNTLIETTATNGSFTINKAGNYTLELYGGGGGGGGGAKRANRTTPFDTYYAGGASGGGGGGSGSSQTVTLSANTPYAISIGIGGTSGGNVNYASNSKGSGHLGGDGGATTFGSWSVPGGKGGYGGYADYRGAHRGGTGGEAQGNLAQAGTNGWGDNTGCNNYGCSPFSCTGGTGGISGASFGNYGSGGNGGSAFESSTYPGIKGSDGAIKISFVG